MTVIRTCRLLSASCNLHTSAARSVWCKRRVDWSRLLRWRTEKLTTGTRWKETSTTTTTTTATATPTFPAINQQPRQSPCRRLLRVRTLTNPTSMKTSPDASTNRTVWDSATTDAARNSRKRRPAPVVATALGRRTSAWPTATSPAKRAKWPRPAKH